MFPLAATPGTEGRGGGQKEQGRPECSCRAGRCRPVNCSAVFEAAEAENEMGLLFGKRNAFRRTREPPMAALWIWLLMGTILGSAARISAVGASNSGFTSASHSGAPANSSRCRSSGSALLPEPMRHVGLMMFFSERVDQRLRKRRPRSSRWPASHVGGCPHRICTCLYSNWPAGRTPPRVMPRTHGRKRRRTGSRTAELCLSCT